MQQVNNIISTLDLEADVSPQSPLRSKLPVETDGSPRSLRRRARLLNALDNWLPYRLWIPPIIFLLVFWVNILLDFPHKAARIEYFNTIMPADFVAANLSANISTDLLMPLLLWTGLWWFTFEILRQLFFIFGIASSERIMTSRRLAQAVTSTDLGSRAVWCCMVLSWIVVFNWFLSKGFLPISSDVNMTGRGGMLWQSIWPAQWQSSNEQRQFLHQPIDLGSLDRTNSSTQRIEKIIHQTYKSTDLPNGWKDTPIQWKKMHPGWEYKFWTDESARKFIAEEYAWFLDTYDGYPYPIQRADALRYFAVYHYGGVYADMDLQPLVSLEKLLTGTDVVLFETPNLGLTNMAFAGKSKSPYFRCVLAQLGVRQDQMHHNFIHFRNWKIISSSGPTFWWAMANSRNCGKSFYSGTEVVRTLSSNFMGRCSLCKGDVSKCHKSGMLKHLVGNSWHNSHKNVGNDASFSHWAFLCQPGIFFGGMTVIVKMVKCYLRPKEIKEQRENEYVHIGLLIVIFWLMHYYL